ncbi:hypothetical protein ACRRTK_016074 [Alexandromys fortis]
MKSTTEVPAMEVLAFWNFLSDRRTSYSNELTLDRMLYGRQSYCGILLYVKSWLAVQKKACYIKSHD